MQGREVDGSNALVQLFESSVGINLSSSKVRFLGRGMELPVSMDMPGRVFDGLGRPIDGGGNHRGRKGRYQRNTDESGSPRLSSEFIQTGSRHRRLNTLVRGQKLPIFSGSGPHSVRLITDSPTKVLGGRASSRSYSGNRDRSKKLISL